MFAHGDLDQKGGLYIGTEIDSAQGILSQKSMAQINAKYPNVNTSFLWRPVIPAIGSKQPNFMA